MIFGGRTGAAGGGAAQEDPGEIPGRWMKAYAYINGFRSPG